ncbi:hypothetical protein GCM10025867_50730 (plasmid) [Frondihabitans sucicola]|uniref:GIY-YIG nuclease family protein n=1 Tax=Frondihabitans sucicola TaxID=1268041 RepID=A0ABM8GWN5_9MICO|nr:hypothetical protein [Frondihabitans sucicola]BDZ52832.1 hypothetical protein GCM10025867_50730 [Frondihabitans sucicola]
MTKKSTYAITMVDGVAAKALGLDDWVRQVNYVGTFASKAAFVRALILHRPREKQSTLAKEVYDWGFREEYVAEGVIYVESLSSTSGHKRLLLDDIPRPDGR